ncbi:MAG TPA: hypothetical protein VGQ89_04400 [Candidatus Limnocylindrales bacterium]|jgi:hypothetical protein|nr:hypothetical protein [Candidatus Limnocylindrales bacterium]
MTRRSLVVTLLLAAAAVACGPGGSSSQAQDAGPVIVTFEVGDERFKALLTEPTDIDTARHLLADDDVPSIPNARVIRETGVNTGYSWSMDPDDIEFADVTIEACDGLPSEVEAGTISGDRYCPWSAVVVAIDPAS